MKSEHQKTILRLTGVATIMLGGLFVSSNVQAVGEKGTCGTSAGFVSGGTCTVLPNETITFTIKGGDGGTGGFGGNGGAGGDGFFFSGTPTRILGGRGGSGALGGDGGVGAKITGTYTNSSAETVTITITNGTDGIAGANGTLGTNGAEGSTGSTSNGGSGTSGTNGLPGVDGTPTELSIGGTILASAGGGRGGNGGGGGGAGTPGIGSSQTVGTAGATGLQGTTGANGEASSLPSPLPTGWAFVSATARDLNLASFTSSGVAATTTTAAPTTTATPTTTTSAPATTVAAFNAPRTTVAKAKKTNLPATGQQSDAIALIAILLTSAGAIILTGRRFAK